MTKMINRRTAIAVAATAALCAGCYGAFAAPDADYQRDRGIMQRPSEGASQSAADATAAPGAADSGASQQAAASQAAPGSTLSQNAPAPEQHSFSPQNGASQNAAGDQNTVKSLLKQARFWHDKFQPTMAAQSLNRVLLADPDNADALYLLSLWSSETGDSEAAERYRRRLELAHPRDSRLQSLQNEKDLSKLSKDQLRRARQLAASGNIPGALQAYRQLFPSGNVPRSLMNEYYLTMSGDPSMQQQALQGIASYIRQNPTDTDAKITYGKLLSYNEQTRESGIEVLDYYARDSQDADNALRQALIWLTPSESSEKYYRNYLNRHPDDTEVRNRYATAVADQMNQSAYSSFRAQNTSQAKSQFEDVLKRDPNNAVALEGLGYLLQATGDYQKASEYLGRASTVSRDVTKKQKLAYDSQFAKARALDKAGDLQGALAAADALEKLPGGDAKSLNLYRAEVERKLKQYQKAEDHLRAVLADDPSNKAAGEMLYYTLKDAGKAGEAKALAASLPADLRDAIAKREAVPPDPAAGLRRQAQASLAAGDEAGAIAALERAVSLKPADPWVRHDLADVLHRAHRDAEARSNLSRLLESSSPAALFAAASLQSKWGDLRGASDTMKRIPPSYNAKGVSDLRRSLTVRAGMADAENYIASGNKAAALNTLQGLERSAAGMVSSDLGHLAYLFMKAGDSAKARTYADRAVQGGISSGASLSDYADTVTVYNELGLYDRARAITQDQNLIANSDPSSLATMRNGEVIRQADRLRTQGRSADAYDMLYGALQQSPQDPDLMCAMARIYQDNNRLDEAEVIYDRAMDLAPSSEAAVKGAINAALANNHEEKALALSQRLAASQDPDTLYLKARVAAGNHQYRQAITYLRQTKSMLEGQPYIADPLATGAAQNPVQAAATHAYNNPFRNDHELTARNQTNTP
ncbi:MAG: tetratricopeptide repeat protein, partial [Succinivibrio sp.]